MKIACDIQQKMKALVENVNAHYENLVLQKSLEDEGNGRGVEAEKLQRYLYNYMQIISMQRMCSW